MGKIIKEAKNEIPKSNFAYKLGHERCKFQNCGDPKIA